MTVHFIGAGPGAADLITLRGRDLIAASPVCLYAGSLVPDALLAHCPLGARIVNTAALSLDEIIAEIAVAHASPRSSPPQACSRPVARAGKQPAFPARRPTTSPARRPG